MLDEMTVMSEKTIQKKRDFGGSKEHDWYQLHPSLRNGKGISKAKAKQLAMKLREGGCSVKIDPLGGKGRFGVYYREYKKRSTEWKFPDVDLYTIPREILVDWFRERTGTSQYPYYESTVSNFIAQNPRYVCGCSLDEVYVWREMRLGSAEKGDASLVDLIIETRKEIWIIEAKYTTKFAGVLVPIEGAVGEVRKYGEKMRNLGWWKDRTLKLAIIWSVYDEIPLACIDLFNEFSIERDDPSF